MEKTGGSRLLQMQARFQQKQLQEKEQKIASLYEAQQARALDRVRQPSSNGTQIAHTQPGKVRQMFEERRTKAGIDKSYPLQPIHNTDKAQARKPIPNGYTKVTNTTTNGYTKVTNTTSKETNGYTKVTSATSAPNGHTKVASTTSREANGYTKLANTTSRVAMEKKSSVRTHTSVSSHSVKKQVSQGLKVGNNNVVNGSGDVNHNQLNHNTIKEMPKTNGIKNTKDEIDGTDLKFDNHKLDINQYDRLDSQDLDLDNQELLENETFPENMVPATTPRSPLSDTVKKVVKKSPAPLSRPAKVPSKPTLTPAKKPSENAVSETNKTRGVMQRGANPVPRRNLPSPQSGGKGQAVAGAEGDACAVCGRRFAADRLPRHQDICRKTHAKKRKPFDVLKHRLAGTEAEPFIGKLRKGTSSSTKLKKPLNSSWRQKHEEFIQAIRAAKQVQAHLNAGGKLSDLPPPPPSENPDYVQCPHCSRRFNQAAADRHIPKCATFQFNKPKPARRR